MLGANQRLLQLHSFFAAEKFLHTATLHIFYDMPTSIFTVSFFQVWRQWTNAYHDRIREKTSYINAQLFHDRCVLHKHLSSWSQHHNHCKQKQKEYEFASCVKNRALASHTLRTWQKK